MISRDQNITQDVTQEVTPGQASEAPPENQAERPAGPQNSSGEAPVVCLANQKGGVGKTTTAIQMADALSRLGQRVLLLDLDAQGNAGSIFLEDEIAPEKSVYAVFKDRAPIKPLVHKTRNERLDLLPSVFQLAEVETLLAGAVDGFFRISEALVTARTEYDIILIDCPPNLGLLTVNAFVATTNLVIPLQTSRFSLDGIQGILDTCSTIHKRFNPNLRISGGVLTMFNPRTTISQAILEPIEEYIRLYQTRVSRSVAVEEAHLMKQTIFEYQPKSRVALEYQALTEEVLRGIQLQKG